MGCRDSPCRMTGRSDDGDHALVWHGGVGIIGRREESDILYSASAKRSSGWPAAAATGSIAKHVGCANRKGLSGKDFRLQNQKDSDALLRSYDADKWQNTAMTDSSKNEHSGLSGDERIPRWHAFQARCCKCRKCRMEPCIGKCF